MTARRKPSKPPPRKKPNSISTDSALFTATCFKLFADLAEDEKLKSEIVSPLVNSVKGTTVFVPQKFGGLFEKKLPPALDGAADFLSQVVFAERLFKRLSFDDPKHVVAFIYCLLRLAPDSVTSQKPFETLKAHFGKYWRWPFVWNVASRYEVVKRRGEAEAARGELNLKDWMDECQKFANNVWLEEKKKFASVAQDKKEMIDSLRAHPAIAKLINQP